MSEPQPTLPYATPGARAPRIIAPSLVLMATALGLVLLGGCFTIGILTLNSPQIGFNPPTTLPAKTGGQYLLEVVLYLLAFACFGGAACLIVTGIKWLRRA